MTFAEFGQLAKIMNAAYSGSTPMFSSADQVKVWHSLLEDLDYEIAKKAVTNMILNSEERPKIATIRKAYTDIVSTPHLGEGEAWDMVREGIRNGTYGATEEFEKFPDAVKRAVGSPSSLSDWAMMNSEDIETVIHGLFTRAYRAEIAKAEKTAMLGAIGTKAGEMAQLTETVVNRLEAKE